jgi:hypothetical protein
MRRKCHQLLRTTTAAAAAAAAAISDGDAQPAKTRRREDVCIYAWKKEIEKNNNKKVFISGQAGRQ